MKRASKTLLTFGGTLGLFFAAMAAVVYVAFLYLLFGGGLSLVVNGAINYSSASQTAQEMADSMNAIVSVNYTPFVVMIVVGAVLLLLVIVLGILILVANFFNIISACWSLTNANALSDKKIGNIITIVLSVFSLFIYAGSMALCLIPIGWLAMPIFAIGLVSTILVLVGAILGLIAIKKEKQNK